MPFFGPRWSKSLSSKHGGGVTVDRHGVRRNPFRFNCCGFTCFR
ncbi:uncharacterized protein RCC_09740 [Ramularia collo-cygni]|uniref:Uncharacterized protein n=1 Tax=Ramularia collo-cygni TaxID=112498 RepID=A0A2D3V7P9_9PEZI|nr:uncharacterized protein RCC_09740 [Ramularia collo-cygni]CZT24023.1 uncharacterized protein RCC_09740 [Ramularia collo-cygni]